MKRRSLLRLGALTPIALFTSRYLGASTRSKTLPIDHQERARQLSELAADIQTPADAQRLVDFVAQLFSAEMPSGWNSSSLRARIAQAEFSAVSDSTKLIPERRIVDAWNAYVDTIQAPEDQKVTSEELHDLRDGFLTSARVFWNRGSRNIWTVPAIYATSHDGSLAQGCRAIESIRLLWDLANMPDNLKGARDRVSKGQLASDLFRSQPQPSSQPTTHGHVEMRSVSRPVEMAQRNYIKRNGFKAFSRAIMTMLDDSLA